MPLVPRRHPRALDRTDQGFGHCDGRIRTDDGTEIVVEQLLGWAKDVRMRW